MVLPTDNSSVRPWHCLQATKGNFVPPRALFFQIEPKIFAASKDCDMHSFGVGVGSCVWLKGGEKTCEQETIFHRPEDFYEWVDLHRNKRGTTWIFAYGLCYCLQLLDWFRTSSGRNERLLTAVLSDPPTILLSVLRGRTVRYVDLQNYWRVPMSRLAKAAGLSWDERPNYFSSKAEAIKRSQSKVNLVKELICKATSLTTRLQLGTWSSTAAGISYNAFRHSFLSSPLVVHGHGDSLAMERASLFGGLNLIASTGYVNGPVYAMDANSLYPSVTLTNPVPVKLRSFSEETNVKALSQALRQWECVACVSLGKSGLPFPPGHIGAFGKEQELSRVYLAGAELRLAHALGLVERIHGLARYADGFPFESFVTCLYGARLEAKRAGLGVEDLFLKMVLNSLFGKFGQQRRYWFDSKETVAVDKWGYWFGPNPKTGVGTCWRNLGGFAQYREKGSEPRHSMPAIPACINAAARVAVGQWIAACKPAEVLYTDTDSVHVKRDGFDRLAASGACDPDRIGALKIQATGADAHYYGLKNYRIGTRYVSNRLSASAVGVGSGLYLDQSRQGFYTSLSRGVCDHVIVVKRTVQIPEMMSCEHAERLEYPEAV